MSVIRVGSTGKYAEGWDLIFGGARSATKKGRATKTKKTVATKAGGKAKKKAAGKRSKPRRSR